MSVAVSAVGIALVAKTRCSANSDCEEARIVQLLFCWLRRCVTELTKCWRKLKNATAESPRGLVPNYTVSHP
jgi:hypothetical protein